MKVNTKNKYSLKYYLKNHTYLRNWLNVEPVSEDFYGMFITSLMKVNVGDKVLDDGSGNGRFSITLARMDAQVISLDINSIMIKEVNRKRYAEGLVDAIHPIRGDIRQLPFRNHVFDKVLCVHNLWYVPEYEKSVKEMLTVTKSNGQIIIDQKNLLFPTFLLIKFFGVFSRKPEFFMCTLKRFTKPFQNHSLTVFSLVPRSFLRSVALTFPVLNRYLQKFFGNFSRFNRRDIVIVKKQKTLALHFLVVCRKSSKNVI